VACLNNYRVISTLKDQMLLDLQLLENTPDLRRIYEPSFLDGNSNNERRVSSSVIFGNLAVAVR
jgi:hypothetical protein